MLPNNSSSSPFATTTGLGGVTTEQANLGGKQSCLISVMAEPVSTSIFTGFDSMNPFTHMGWAPE